MLENESSCYYRGIKRLSMKILRKRGRETALFATENSDNKEQSTRLMTLQDVQSRMNVRAHGYFSGKIAQIF